MGIFFPETACQSPYSGMGGLKPFIFFRTAGSARDHGPRQFFVPIAQSQQRLDDTKNSYYPSFLLLDYLIISAGATITSGAIWGDPEQMTDFTLFEPSFNKVDG